jgi:pyridoxamine 5'-phosphate oxidase
VLEDHPHATGSNRQLPVTKHTALHFSSIIRSTQERIMENPIEKFNTWWKSALSNSPLKQKNAVCVSTIDDNGYPSGRFVDLKAVNELGFVFCTYLNSAKGQHINENSKIALTLWWDHIGYQVRVLGVAQSINEKEAITYWKMRSKEAQLTTTAFEQSQPLANEEELQTRVARISKQYINSEIPKPNTWGGYLIKPQSIEFLTFRESRLHLRELYTLSENGWNKNLLQP